MRYANQRPTKKWEVYLTGRASSAWHVLLARAAAWLGRGLRTPVRKALLAGSVTPETYGRAFGFGRMMDTLGAIVGPATALLVALQDNTNFSLADQFAILTTEAQMPATCHVPKPGK